MDIANINAVTRSGLYSAPRSAVTSGLGNAVADAARRAALVARGQQQPAEQVLQGELLRKRRTTTPYDTADLLRSMQTMDRLMRDPATTTTNTAPPRDARRAIAAYTQQTTTSNVRTGTTAAVSIDYFV